MRHPEPDHPHPADTAGAGRAVVFGEVLFDCFPDGERRLGGAPLNVAWHLQGFGLRPLLVSAVGEDPAAEEVVAAMRRRRLESSALQRRPDGSTGEVQVSLGGNGQPSFEIPPGQAWDAIDPETAAGAVDGQPIALLYHGTLAARSSPSAAALTRVADAAAAPILVDVNLRSPWWSPDLVDELLARARWCKVSEEELEELLPGAAPEGGDLAARAETLRRQHDLELVAVSRGARGALAVDAEGRTVAVPAARVDEVVDTVGAGDAFTAVLALGLVRGWALRLTLERATGFAAMTCQLRGALPPGGGVYRLLDRQWKGERR